MSEHITSSYGISAADGRYREYMRITSDKFLCRLRIEMEAMKVRNG